MKYPSSESLGRARNPEGQSFQLHFYGEDQGAAVITGPISIGIGSPVIASEVHREPATDAYDALGKLIAWVDRNGWRIG